MVTLRGIMAILAILTLASCTNPFSPDDRGGNPEDEERDGQDDRQGLVQDALEITFV